jgi:hypothetical protein
LNPYQSRNEVEKQYLAAGNIEDAAAQQVEKDSPKIVKFLKTTAAMRQVDLHPDVVEYLQRYRTGKTGLLFQTANGTPHLYGNLEDRWLTPRLKKMKLEEDGMGFHAFKRFRKTGKSLMLCLVSLKRKSTKFLLSYVS